MCAAKAEAVAVLPMEQCSTLRLHASCFWLLEQALARPAPFTQLYSAILRHATKALYTRDAVETPHRNDEAHPHCIGLSEEHRPASQQRTPPVPLLQTSLHPSRVALVLRGTR